MSQPRSCGRGFVVCRERAGTMAVTHIQYSSFPGNLMEGAVSDLAAGGTTAKVALLAATYTPNQDGHDNWGDVSAHQISAGGEYVAGGQALGNKDVSTTGRVSVFDADDVVWEDSTITAAYAVVYDDTPASAGDKKLITLVDFDGEESSENGDFTISWHADGIARITAAAAS